MGLVAWRRPQALRPAAMRAAVVAPVQAAAGWLQEALIPAGEPLAEEAAQALVMQWQATKAQALGAGLALYQWLYLQCCLVVHGCMRASTAWLNSGSAGGQGKKAEKAGLWCLFRRGA